MHDLDFEFTACLMNYKISFLEPYGQDDEERCMLPPHAGYDVCVSSTPALLGTYESDLFCGQIVYIRNLTFAAWGDFRERLFGEGC